MNLLSADSATKMHRGNTAARFLSQRMKHAVIPSKL
jgi:hypothetical protein